MYSGDPTNSFNMTSYHFFLAIVLQNVSNQYNQSFRDSWSDFYPYNALNGVLLITKWNQMSFISLDKFFVFGQFILSSLNCSVRHLTIYVIVPQLRSTLQFSWSSKGAVNYSLTNC